MKRVKHYFQISIVDESGLPLFEEEPRDLNPGDTLCYGPGIFEALIDGKIVTVIKGSVQLKWLDRV